MLDATRLRVLVAVARCGSVTEAAHALNYAQPSISHHIARLEAETGAKLLERAGRGVRLTEAGQLLADRAEEILGRLDAAEAELAAHVGLAQDRVRVATFGSAIAAVVATACAALHAEQTDTGICLTQADPDVALRMLHAGEVDLALVYRYFRDGEEVVPLPGSPPGSPLGSPLGTELGEANVVLEEAVYLVGPASKPAGGGAVEEGGAAVEEGGAAVEDGGTPGDGAAPGDGAGDHDQDRQARSALLAACTGQRWITTGEHCDGLLAELCRCAGLAPQIAIRTADSVAAQALVAAGLGVAIMPALALHAARHPGVEAIGLPGISRQTLVVTYPPSADSLAVIRLREAIAAASGATAPAISRPGGAPQLGRGARH